MDYLKITDSLRKEVESKLSEVFHGRHYYAETNHYHNNRFIQLGTILHDNDIHYEYIKGYVELHLEGKFSGYEYNTIWRKLIEESKQHSNLSWHRWDNRNQGRCRINIPIDSVDDIIKCFKKISEIFDPVLEPFSAEHGEAEVIMQKMDNLEALPPADSMKVEKLTYGILKIKELPFNNFIIPEYQRPYKWGVKNVNQLINDLLHFKYSDEYRLGTLVLHENNIVDGQQRIVTLSLLLYELFNKKEISAMQSYQEVQDRIETFWKRTEFTNEHSIGHVRENLTAIEDRLDDLDDSFLDFLLNKCQFVVVRLPEISEAFQFFDSQNSRGKDLEPHDLLKAFHLREIKKLSDKDSDNITKWQDLNSQRLVELFLTLYRVKRWTKNNSGKEFTKDNIDVFKGISLEDKRYPFYMQQIICHFFTSYYTNEPSRNIDQSKMEFPFQIDQTCINGSRFFDMIRYYDALFNKIIDENEYKDYGSTEDKKSAYRIIQMLNNHPKRTRTGDIFVRQLFNCLLIYYVDRFGFAEINKVVRKIFRYAYQIRLTQYSVQLPTIDNNATSGIIFKTIRDAQSPYDIINLMNPQINSYASNADEEIKQYFQ